jgi:hypothetical protein
LNYWISSAASGHHPIFFKQDQPVLKSGFNQLIPYSLELWI